MYGESNVGGEQCVICTWCDGGGGRVNISLQVVSA